MKKKKELDFVKIFEKINIKKGDIVVVASDLLKILIHYKSLKKKFDANKLVDALISVVGKKGTLIFNCFNWEFCKRKKFHYLKTISHSGSLSNIVLKRKDFVRTQNPIYSFLINGKLQDKILKMNHDNCFSLDSPFGYLIKKNAKQLFIDVDYKVSGFALVHVAEQSAKVNYRYLKTFKGNYFHKNFKLNSFKTKMLVRKKNMILKTYLDKKMDVELKKNKSLNEKKISDINFSVIKMKNAYKIMLEDLMNKRNLVKTIKLNK